MDSWKGLREELEFNSMFYRLPSTGVVSLKRLIAFIFQLQNLACISAKFG